MSAEYSVEEVRAYAEALREALRMYRAGRSTIVSLDNSAAAAPDMLTVLAERIKADEGAVPAWQAFFDKYAIGGLTAPSCFGCGMAWASWDGCTRHAELPSIFLCSRCAEKCKGITHPSAQAAQLWEMKQRACRAHALCNELRLAHPEIPELGDDGVLHEAIHDILRVDTPTAAQAQTAQVDVARFGHHHDPATDFCVEVEALLGEIENRRVGFKNGTPSQAELDARIERALSFRVGGDPHAVRAKQQLRAATTAEPMAQGEVPLPFSPYLVSEWKAPTERHSWTAYTEQQMRAFAAACLAAQPRAVPDGWAKPSDVADFKNSSPRYQSGEALGLFVAPKQTERYTLPVYFGVGGTP